MAVNEKVRPLRERLLRDARRPARIARVIQVEQPPPEIAALLGLDRKRPAPRKKNGRSCEGCFFRKRMLCALDLDEPCSTFRADTPDGLVPPRQPALLLRASSEALAESA
jgi:hypothetical protein